MRSLDEVLGRLHRVGPADLRKRPVLALQEHMRRDDERAREHVASARHEHRAAAVLRGGRQRRVEGVGVGRRVVGLGTEILHVEDVRLPHGTRHGHPPRSGVVPVASAREPVADPHGVASGGHVGRHARVQAPHVRLFKRQLAFPQHHARLARRPLAVGRERPSEDAQHAARGRRIAPVALQPPDRGDVDRERRRLSVVVHHAPFDDLFGRTGERKHQPRIGKHRGRAGLFPLSHDAHMVPPRSAVQDHVVARAGRPCHNRRIRAYAGGKGTHAQHQCGNGALFH